MVTTTTIAEARVIIRPDSSGFSAELRTQLSNIKKQAIDVDVKSDKLAAQINRTVARIKPPPIELGVDTERFESSVTGALERVATASDKTERRFRVLGQGLTRIGIGSGLAVLANEAIALSAALTPVTGIIAAIPALAAQASAGIGALLVGFSGIGAAFKETSKAAGAAAVDTTSLQRAVEAASRGIVQAQRDVGKALRDAEDASYELNQASRTLLETQEEALSAESALTAAREEATQVLASYQRQLTGAALSQEEAELGVLEARKRLIELSKSGEQDKFFEILLSGAEDAQKKLKDLAKTQASDSVAQRRAKLDVAEAELRLQDAIENSADLQKKAAKAQKLGVEGDERVIDAKERLEDANNRVVEANHSLVKSQQAVADANQGIADSQEQVVLANQQLADSLAALSKAQSGAGGAASKAAEAMAALSPAARATVRTILNLKDEWEGLRRTVQESLFSGTDVEIQRLANSSLPTLTAGLSEVAGGFNEIFKQASQAISSEFFQERAASIFRGTAEALRLIADATGPLLRGLINLADVGQPFLLSFTKWSTKALKSFGEFLESERGARKMRAVLDKASKALQHLWRIAINVGKGIGNIFQAAGADKLLGSLETVTAKFAELTGSPEGQKKLSEFFNNLGEIASGMAQVLPEVIELISDLLSAFNALPGPVKETATSFLAWSIVLGPLISGLAGLSVAAKGLVSFGSFFAKGAESAIAAARGIDTVGDSAKALAGVSDDLAKQIKGVEDRISTINNAKLDETFSKYSKESKTFQDELKNLNSQLTTLTDSKTTVDVKYNIEQAIDASTAGKNTAGSFLAGLAGGLAPRIGAAFLGVVTAGLALLSGPVLLGIAAAVGTLIAGLLIFKFREQIGRFFSETLPRFLSETLPRAFIDALGKVAFALGFVSHLLFDTGKALLQGLVDGVQWVWDNVLQPIVIGFPTRVLDTLGDLGKFLFEKGKELLQGLKDGAEWVWDHIIFPFITGRPALALKGLGDLGKKLLQKGKDLLQGFLDGVTDIWDNYLYPFITQGPGKIVDALKDVGTFLVERGKQLIQGLIDGVQSGFGAAGKLGKFLYDKFQEGWDKESETNSPSKAMYDRGVYLMQGLAKGIESQRQALSRQAAGIAADVANSFSGSGNLALNANGGGSVAGLVGNRNFADNRQFHLAYSGNDSYADVNEQFARMQRLAPPVVG